MFERYTESARRALFYARYEASECGVPVGGPAIETEHLLLGLLRDNKGIIKALFAQANVRYDEVRAEIPAREPVKEKIATSVELPFSPDMKRALQRAAEEADRLLHSHIGPEHLLLGLLRVEGSVAASVLNAHGLTLDIARERVVPILAATPSDVADESGFQERIGTIETLINQTRDMLDRIQRLLESLKRHPR